MYVNSGTQVGVKSLRAPVCASEMVYQEAGARKVTPRKFGLSD